MNFLSLEAFAFMAENTRRLRLTFPKFRYRLYVFVEWDREQSTWIQRWRLESV